MRAVVYGVEVDPAVGGGGWRWCVSVALEADAAWWSAAGARRLYVLGSGGSRRLSLGQAAELRAGLEASRRRFGSAAVPGGSWVGVEELCAGWALDRGEYERWTSRLAGRLLLREELEAMDGLPEDWVRFVQWGALMGRLRIRHGVERMREASALARLAGRLEGMGVHGLRVRGGDRWEGYRCVRCGSEGRSLLPVSECALCGGPCPYCEACLGMGRVRYCALLVQGVAAGVEFAAAGALGGSGVRARWGLSSAQADAAGEALRFLERPGGGKFLLWAVTGAGKTEMMFPLVERALAVGGRALVATPRKDVVLELMPRVKAAFPEARVVTLYGGSEERWEAGAITIATTHQLFRFREAFDLVVLDEIDAFPYHGDPQLTYAAEGACRHDGKFVLLSATPPTELRRAASRGKLPHAKVCVRFHGRPLPVPQRLGVPPLRRWADSALPRSLREAVEVSLRRGAQLFVFVPWIAAIPGVVRLLEGAFPDVPIGGTSSKDEERGEKVLSFRGRELRIIVTTTILERGVTVPRTDVFILDAHSGLFDGASLVQMAGRAGRKAEDPSGNVYFCSAEWTKSQKEAIRDIKAMNDLARKRGYLFP
ncbi:DEAD/DEAH box helicase [Paenibacillus antri]|uniref:DEAD/DEAH box helicase n=1 Tax=Paenibacillus antri TaxID=2582848 RepID=A0A5R9GGM7_9BACL|nr:DEAD/DEAH box helicase [Paenibacillus antri]TLS50565.1 DEAD/DEAH box helicase [Paenibacillus antri]